MLEIIAIALSMILWVAALLFAMVMVTFSIIFIFGNIHGEIRFDYHYPFGISPHKAKELLSEIISIRKTFRQIMAFGFNYANSLILLMGIGIRLMLFIAIGMLVLSLLINVT